MSVKTALNELKYDPLSEEDIRRYLGNRTLVMKYADLNLYKDIDALFTMNGEISRPPYPDSCVILLETKPRFGHWICIKKNSKNGRRILSFFDSYGGFPDKQKHYVSEDFLQSSGQEFNKICQLLYDASFKGYLVEFSHRKLQNIRNDKMATCGHWCCIFIKSNMPVDDFNDYLDSFGIKNKDDLVVMLYFNLIPNKKRMKYF